MKRGRTRRRVVFGDAIEASAKDRKTLAAETRARVRSCWRRFVPSAV